MILTSEQHAEHLFACRNTQQDMSDQGIDEEMSEPRLNMGNDQ